MIIIGLICWWLCGFLYQLISMKRESYRINDFDVLTAMIAGIFGPLWFIMYAIAYIANKH